MFWLLLKMKEKLTKIESRLTFVEENYIKQMITTTFFSVKPHKKPTYL